MTISRTTGRTMGWTLSRRSQRNRLLVALGLAVFGTAAPTTLSGQSGRELIRRGEYEDGLEVLRQDANSEFNSPAGAELIRALLETGEYEEAETQARSALSSGGNATFQALLGEALYETGQLSEAEEMLRSASQANSSERLTALINLGRLLYDRGDAEGAFAVFDSFIDVYNQNPNLSARDLTAVGRAVLRLGQNSPVLFQDALKAFDEAISRDPTDLEPRVRVGFLFLDKYNSTDAHSAFDEVLSINPNHPLAHLGVAQALNFDGVGGSIEQAQMALEVNPNLVPARTFLARRYLALENLPQAEEEARRALAVNPTSLDGLSVIAAIEFLKGNETAFRNAEAQVLRLNPGYAELYVTLAELSVQHRKYEEGVQFGQQAVALDSLSWEGWGALGMNQLRTGSIDEGIRNLERAFEGDPYNVWFKNTLDLTDTFERYDVISTENFELVLDRRESDLLAPYFSEVAERALAALSARYGYTPPTPIRVEAFPSQADFSVRTVGLAGLGALGVSFGPVIAMDSPGAGEAGEFNWASTLWHELAHSVHLSISNHEVPRWFTEGLAVHEQRIADPSWGHNASISFLQRYSAGDVPPISQLTNGFLRPQYPEQVIHSYYQSSLVSQLIEEEWGFEAIKGILLAYRDGLDTDEAFRRELGIGIEEFDDRFTDFFEEEFAGPLAAVGSGPPVFQGPPNVDRLREQIVREPNNFGLRVLLGRLLVELNEFAEAERHLEHALQLFPDYAGPDSPLWYLGQIHMSREEFGPAAELLSRLTSMNESHYLAAMEEALAMERLGRPEGAAHALGKAIYIYPYQPELHVRLAELYSELGRRTDAVRERQAVLSLDPVDRAEALYQLAKAQYEAGDLSSARGTVLRSLEIAPTFDEALELLLDIRGGSTAGGEW